MAFREGINEPREVFKATKRTGTVMTNDEFDEVEQHSDDDDCPPFEGPHMDTGGCDHRYHCCEHHGNCVEGQHGCVLYGMRQDEAEEYAKELEQEPEET